MANYVLTNTADDINTAIGKALNPDSNLTGVVDNDPSLVTSGAVKTYVDSKTTNINTDISNIQTDLVTRTKAAVITNAGIQTFTGFYQYDTFQLVSQVDADFVTLTNNEIALSSGHYLLSFGFTHRPLSNAITTYFAWRFTDPSSGAASSIHDTGIFTSGNEYTYLPLLVPPTSSRGARNVWLASDQHKITSRYLKLDSNTTFKIEGACGRSNCNVEIKDLSLVLVKL